MTQPIEQERPRPDFYIFQEVEKGKTSYVGAAFSHVSGKGFNILIGKTRYVAFRRNQTEEQSQSSLEMK